MAATDSSRRKARPALVIAGFQALADEPSFLCRSQVHQQHNEDIITSKDELLDVRQTVTCDLAEELILGHRNGRCLCLRKAKHRQVC